MIEFCDIDLEINRDNRIKAIKHLDYFYPIYPVMRVNYFSFTAL